LQEEKFTLKITKYDMPMGIDPRKMGECVDSTHYIAVRDVHPIVPGELCDFRVKLSAWEQRGCKKVFVGHVGLSLGTGDELAKDCVWKVEIEV
jgi:hypothetical protein